MRTTLSADAGVLAEAAEALLRRHTVGCWFPRCVEDAGDGGFHQDYDRTWTPLEPTRRLVVFQARMVWVTATLARRRPDIRQPFIRWAERGLEHLGNAYRDPEGGGVAFWRERRTETHAYGVSFVLYGAAALIRTTGSEAARAFALEVFEWFEAVGWDRDLGTFREALPLEGSAGGEDGAVDLMGVPLGCTTSNTQLHIVEALTELTLAIPDHDRIRERLEAVLLHLESFVDGGRSPLYHTYAPDGRPVRRSMSYGHDVEAFHLAVLARRALGLPDATPLEATARVALRRGVDRRCGGILHGRRPWRPTDSRKVFWAQVETMAGLALLHRRAGGESTPWLDPLASILDFARERMVDEEHGGWWEVVGRRGRRLKGWKGHAWKAAYHEVRGLLDAVDLLRGP